MTKQEILDKLEEIAQNSSQDEYLIAKKAFNFGLEVAANNVKTYKSRAHSQSKITYKKKVDKNSILQYKI